MLATRNLNTTRQPACDAGGIDIAAHDYAADRRVLGLLLLLCVAGALGSLWLMSEALAGRMPGFTRPQVSVRGDPPAAVKAPFDETSLRHVSASEAERLNAAIPVVAGTHAAAAAFSGRAADAIARERSLDCLTAAVHYEAGGESIEGQRAVAQVILNRVRHPSFPNAICDVVFEGSNRRTGCQFSFTCDGSLARIPNPERWKRAREVARSALAGQVYAPVGWATHYHTRWILPYWADSLDKIGNVGAHVFYVWRGGWGQPRAFSQRYSGVESPVSWSSPGVKPPAVPADAEGGQKNGPPQSVAVTDRPVLAGAARASDVVTPVVDDSSRWILQMKPEQ